MPELISLGALVVAAGAAWLAWKQRERLSAQETVHAKLANELRAEIAGIGREANDLQRRLTEIEEDRRTEELAPRLTAEYDRRPSAGTSAVIRLTNQDARRIDALAISVVDPPGLPTLVRGLVIGGLATLDGNAGQVGPGAEVKIGVDENMEGSGGPLRLRCIATYGSRVGEAIVEVDVPGLPSVTVL